MTTDRVLMTSSGVRTLTATRRKGLRVCCLRAAPPARAPREFCLQAESLDPARARKNHANHGQQRTLLQGKCCPNWCGNIRRRTQQVPANRGACREILPRRVAYQVIVRHSGARMCYLRVALPAQVPRWCRPTAALPDQKRARKTIGVRAPTAPRRKGLRVCCLRVAPLAPTRAQEHSYRTLAKPF